MGAAIIEYLKQNIKCPVTKGLLAHGQPMLLENKLFICTERDWACLIQEDSELHQAAQGIGIQVIAFGART
ncbi:hypothetical protein H6G13_17530 [Pseudanabaena sp. FACHB-2040]|nr:hypothetical protein [Pseudanabaena sp. FACHB-2040]